MRQLVFSPRWMVWHLLTLGAMVTCGWLAAWQWERAGSAMGSAVNVGYGLQWPFFAVFFGVMWWRMLRLESRRIKGIDTDEVASVRPAPTVDAQPAPTEAAASRTDDGADAHLPPPRVVDPASSPFGVRRTAVPSVTEDEDPALASYNRMLARLAARDQDN
ncbi:hypothetical protein ACVGVM_00425 [Pseudonocardia bannensis]|uniref:DNA-binding transcriptional regulator of glucitol operon n=1 Tax=Pseudonocardia bannensis TaxID=630973 RepID=A0A848DMI7_9PSEU|nr:hypothetical protein [Pseudonocardia bannensis]NMH94000.1 hypothetical protein [Pseudonocardia bannensis]